MSIDAKITRKVMKELHKRDDFQRADKAIPALGHWAMTIASVTQNIISEAAKLSDQPDDCPRKAFDEWVKFSSYLKEKTIASIVAKDFALSAFSAAWKMRTPVRESSNRPNIERIRQLLVLITSSLGRKFQTSDYLPDRFDDKDTPPSRHLITEACAEFMQHNLNILGWADKALGEIEATYKRNEIEGEKL